MLDILVLFAAGFGGSVLIALAGGGTFITFPALIFVGVSAIGANATSAVALFPGSILSAWAFRREIRTITEINVKVCAIVSLVGAIAGALLLLLTPSSIFAGLVPWLMLFATVTFAAGNLVPLNLLRRYRLGPAGALAILFVFSIYGGYFGGGLGFLLLSALTLYGIRDILAMNGLKLLLATLMSVTANIIFIGAGVVDWPSALPMLVGSLAGGYAGAHGARRFNQKFLKGFITLLGASLTAYYFWRGV